MTAKTRHGEADVTVKTERKAGAVPGQESSSKGAGLLEIRGVSLFVEVLGQGYPLVVMHGGPSADHFTMLPFRRCADQFTEQAAEVMAAIRRFITEQVASADDADQLAVSIDDRHALDAVGVPLPGGSGGAGQQGRCPPAGAFRPSVSRLLPLTIVRAV